VQPHVVVIHQSRGLGIPYLDRIDHVANAVTYVCVRNLLDRVPGHAAAAVAEVDDPAAIPHAVRDLAARFGVPERIVALSERDILAAAYLREELGVPGQRPDHALRFRDKLVMSEVVGSSGISLPPFQAAGHGGDVAKFAEVYGFPLIVKPRLGSGSRSVVKINASEDFSALPDLDSEPFLVQNFCPDDVGAIDGVWTGAELGPWRASRYIGTCFEFAYENNTMGYVEIDDTNLTPYLSDFAESVLAALSPGTPTVFHLEHFLGDSDGAPCLRFLEIGARAGGGGTPDVWREVHGYDLLGASIDIHLGRTPDYRPLTDGVVAGDLLIRPSIEPPCTIVGTRLDVPRAFAPYHQSVPCAGTDITVTSGYSDIGAAFRFRGLSTAEVMTAMKHTEAGFHMECLPRDLSARIGVA